MSDAAGADVSGVEVGAESLPPQAARLSVMASAIISINNLFIINSSVFFCFCGVQGLSLADFV
ncbi:hypothetical protein SDC9_68203 [bioreactor metagenome]|uniref:Uncharacterized protein n=1 Tax=bioreactor metagenome TaxID=1076179 RepID=A0A644Y162_9ZZZZ